MARVCKDWRAVPGYEGFYEVSDEGDVRSVDRTIVSSNGKRRYYPGRILKQATNRAGYKRVVLCIKGEQSNESVHRLVAKAFIPNRKSDDLEVRHLDHNPANNTIGNLAWGTSKDNKRDSMKDGRLKGKNQHAHKTHCPRGHAYDYVYPDGRRDCKTCRNESIRRHRARKKKGKAMP